MVVELLEQHEQQQCDDHPDGRLGKHIIHENSSDADRTNTNLRLPILPAILLGIYSQHARRATHSPS
jgi:hypothetical protein